MSVSLTEDGNASLTEQAPGLTAVVVGEGHSCGSAGITRNLGVRR